MSGDLTPVSGHTLEAQLRYAEALAASDLLPTAYRKRPANVLVATEYGRALGLDPVTAMQMVHIVDGKPTASAQLIGALVRRAGHRLRVTGDATHAVAEIVRRDDPDFTFRAEWTMDRARAAGLATKGPWKTFPDAMLKARAITEVARDACPEALSGVAYTAEELGAEVVTADPAPMLTPATVPAAALTAPGAPVDAVVVADNPCTREQKQLLTELLNQSGVTDRNARLEIIETILGRDVKTVADLTFQTAQIVIGTLDQIIAEHRPADSNDPTARILEVLEELT